MENVLIRGFNRNDVERDLEFIRRYIWYVRLQTELKLLPRIAENANKKVAIINIAGTFNILRSAGVRKLLIPEAIKLAKLIDAGNKCNKWQEVFGFKTIENLRAIINTVNTLWIV